MTEVILNNRYYHLQKDMIKWCEDNIGSGGWIHHSFDVWYVTSAFGNTMFYFKHPVDATLFLLKWK